MNAALPPPVVRRSSPRKRSHPRVRGNRVASLWLLLLCLKIIWPDHVFAPARPAAGPATTLARSYDGYGQVLRETTTLAGSAFASVSQTWNAAGRRATLDEAGAAPAAPLFTYTYQADGQLARIAAATSATTHNVNFAYATTGLLTARTNPWRTQTIATRDAAGRIRSQSTTVAGTVVMAETTGYFANGTLDTYGLTRGGATAWDETRSYGYNSRGQVISEGFTPAAQLPLALNFQFDQGAAAGLGIRTAARVGTGAPQSWQLSSGGINSLARVTLDESTPANRIITAAGVSLGADRVNLTLDGTPVGPARHPGWADPVGAWTKALSVQPGSHTLKAELMLRGSGRCLLIKFILLSPHNPTHANP